MKQKTEKIALLAIVFAVSVLVFYANAPHITRALPPSARHESCSNTYEKPDICDTPPCERKPIPSPSPLPPAALIQNPAWQSVAGYAQRFTECNTLCNAYRGSGCSEQTALDYCNALVAVDLSKDGKISGSDFGNTPMGGMTCETNTHCYDVVKSCPCSGGQTLDLGTCVQLLFNSYSRQGFNFIQAYSTISTNLRGSCSQQQSPT